jgi:hypothetical protein
MDEQPSEILPFIKALADADRLRVIGLLAQRPASLKQLADELHLPVRDAYNHLAFLERVGVVSAQAKENETLYELSEGGLAALSRRQFAAQQRATYVPAPELDKKSRKVLSVFLNADGSIRQIPIQDAPKLRIILDYLIEAFTPGMNYTEKEVNTIIRRFNVDVAGLRRDLVDASLLARERNGSRYWRPEKAPEINADEPDRPDERQP